MRRGGLAPVGVGRHPLPSPTRGGVNPTERTTSLGLDGPPGRPGSGELQRVDRPVTRFSTVRDNSHDAVLADGLEFASTRIEDRSTRRPHDSVRPTSCLVSCPLEVCRVVCVRSALAHVCRQHDDSPSKRPRRPSRPSTRPCVYDTRSCVASPPHANGTTPPDNSTNTSPPTNPTTAAPSTTQPRSPGTARSSASSSPTSNQPTNATPQKSTSASASDRGTRDCRQPVDEAARNSSTLVPVASMVVGKRSNQPR